MDFSHALAQLPKANFISANVRLLFETIATTYVNNETDESNRKRSIDSFGNCEAQLLITDASVLAAK